MTDSLSSKFNIKYYGADYPVFGLVQRLREGTIVIPNFQREYVWDERDASRFIESLLLGLPIPTIFFAQDKFSNNLIIIDGQQRLLTLLYYYNGKFPNNKTFKLSSLDSEYNGKTYDKLSPEDRQSLDYSILPCTIIAEGEETNRMYYLFERLNTSGTPLSSQEIRQAIYHGPFNDLIKELSNLSFWKKLYWQKDNRLNGQELILRFFALHFNLENYNGNLNDFLNEFMRKNRSFDVIEKNKIEHLFIETVQYILESIGENAFYHKKTFYTILYEVLMLTVSRNKLSKSLSHSKFKEFYDSLILDMNFWQFSKGSTTSKSNFLKRIELANQKLAIILNESGNP